MATKRDRSDPGFQVINVRVPDALAEKLEVRAKALSTGLAKVTRSSVIRVAIEAYLESTPAPKKAAGK